MEDFEFLHFRILEFLNLDNQLIKSDILEIGNLEIYYSKNKFI